MKRFQQDKNIYVLLIVNKRKDIELVNFTVKQSKKEKESH